jgi:hypothetical protein
LGARAGVRGGVSSYALVVGGFTVLALLVRVVALGHQPLGGDESFTALVSRRGWLDMYAVVRSDSAAPLSYALTHLASLLSTDPGVLRLPAALAGTLAVPLAAALSRRIGGDRAGMWGALACAVLPALVLPARDARMYALAGTMVLAMALTLWRAVEHPSRGRLIAHACVVAAAMLSDYFAVFAVVASLVAGAVALRPSRAVLLRVVAASLAGCAVLLLWLPFATAQLHHAGQPFWLDGIGLLGSVGGVLSGFFGGPPFDPHLAQHAQLVALQGVGTTGVGVPVLVLVILVVLRLLRVVHRPLSTSARAVVYVVGCGLGAAVLIGLVSIVHPVLDARYVSVVWTPLFALVGWGLAQMRWAAVLLVAGMVAGTAAVCVVTTRADVASVVHGRLDGRVGTGDLVLASPDTYLQVLAAADASVVSRTHVEAPAPPWYFGVAAYPPGAVIHGLPPGTRTITVVSEPDERPPPLVRGDAVLDRSCATLVCVTVYGAAAGSS